VGGKTAKLFSLYSGACSAKNPEATVRSVIGKS
jgi:hypothetical protein